MAKKAKILIDTSCVLFALDRGLAPAVAKQLPLPKRAAAYYTSQYLRMEFFRRWIITGIEVYFQALLTDDFDDALAYHSQSFSPREVKVVLMWAAKFGKSLPPTSSKEKVEWFGDEVLKFARAYDILFSKSVSAKSGCKLGELSLDSHCPTRAQALQDFHERFTSQDKACNLEGLFQFEKGCPRLKMVLKASKEDVPDAKARRALTLLKKALCKFIQGKLNLTCRNCSKIGDAIIAMEQPRTHTLYHTDHSFSALCPLLGKKHIAIGSLRKVTSAWRISK